MDQQLDDSTRSFLNDPQNYRFEENKFYVSRIFKWFAEDFNNGVVDFYLQYATGELKNKLASQPEKISVKFMDYDWSLNGK